MLLVAVILLLTGLVIYDWSAQPASRYLLTVAVVDDHSLELDPYEDYLGIDQAYLDGHVFSDKAPYQPLLAAPAFHLYRSAGGDSFPEGFLEGRFLGETNYGLWWVTLWSSVLPAAALTVVIRRMVARTHPELATRVALATMLGTTMLPFSGWLFGHVLAALCVTSAWYLLRRDGDRTSFRTFAAAGLLIGAGIGVEYAVAALAMVFLVHVVTSRRFANVAAFSGGTFIGTVPLLIYNWLVFHNPFEVSYQGHLKSFKGEGALGVYNLQLPQWRELEKVFVGNRGLFVVTPIVLLAVVGAGLMVLGRHLGRRDAWVSLAALGTMLLVSTGIDGYGGDSPGPRYLIPAIPLLAVPMAEAWRRLPMVCSTAAIFGTAVMVTATITNPAIDTSYPDPLSQWARWLRSGDLATNVITGDHHSWVLLISTFAGLALGASLVGVGRVQNGSASE